jgi:hypothetical protein
MPLDSQSGWMFGRLPTRSSLSLPFSLQRWLNIVNLFLTVIHVYPCIWSFKPERLPNLCAQESRHLAARMWAFARNLRRRGWQSPFGLCPAWLMLALLHHYDKQDICGIVSLTYQFNPCQIFSKPRLSTIQVIASRQLGFTSWILTRVTSLVPCPEPYVERSEHGNVDTKTRKHELNCTQHEGYQTCSCEVSEKIW